MKSKLLVVSSSFPRNKNDFKGFIYLLCKKLQRDFDIFLIAPHSKNSLKFEIMDGMAIFRHKITPFGDFGMVYDSGILPNIKKNPLLILLIPFLILSQVFAIKKIIDQFGINIIHAHWLLPQGLSSVLYRLVFNYKIKILVSALGSDINFFDNYFGNFIKRFILHRVDEVTVVSNYFKQKLEQLGYKRSISVLPLGVDTTVFHPNKRNESIKKYFRIKGDLILYVGWVIEAKGIQFLIEAMQAVVKAYPTSRLIVVGVGNLLENMKLLAKNLGLKEKIFFVGRVSDEDLPSYYATADLFVLPSSYEGFPVAVEEAMACGIVSVVSDIPVFKDLAEEVNCVCITRKCESEDIAKSIKYLLSKKTKRTSLKKEARQYAVTHFDWAIIAGKFTKIIQSMAK